ncbi:hypothetical protein OPU97_006878, partial [Pseudomonas aeruginosa]
MSGSGTCIANFLYGNAHDVQLWSGNDFFQFDTKHPWFLFVTIEAEVQFHRLDAVPRFFGERLRLPFINQHPDSSEFIACT